MDLTDAGFPRIGLTDIFVESANLQYCPHISDAVSRASSLAFSDGFLERVEIVSSQKFEDSLMSLDWVTFNRKFSELRPTSCTTEEQQKI